MFWLENKYEYKRLRLGGNFVSGQDSDVDITANAIL